MFKDKGFIKFKIDDYEVVINYLNQDGVLRGITKGDSRKVSEFNTHDNILAGEGSKATEFVPVSVKVVSDKDLVRKLYDEMTALKFNHYKTYEDDLVIIEVTIK